MSNDTTNRGQRIQERLHRRGRTPRLERSAIIQAALQLVDEQGLDSLTLRALANKLGVRAPALYWHVTNKQELIDEMARAMLDNNTNWDFQRNTETWQEWLKLVARKRRQILLSHRDGARILAGANMAKAKVTPHSIELTLQVMVEAGFTPQEAWKYHLAIAHYVIGSVFEMQEEPEIEAAERQSMLNSLKDHADEFPVLVSLLSNKPPHSRIEFRESAFEAGLDVIIKGLETTLAK